MRLPWSLFAASDVRVYRAMPRLRCVGSLRIELAALSEFSVVFCSLLWLTVPFVSAHLPQFPFTAFTASNVANGLQLPSLANSALQVTLIVYARNAENVIGS